MITTIAAANVVLIASPKTVHMIPLGLSMPALKFLVTLIIFQYLRSACYDRPNNIRQCHHPKPCFNKRSPTGIISTKTFTYRNAFLKWFSCYILPSRVYWLHLHQVPGLLWGGPYRGYPYRRVYRGFAIFNSTTVPTEAWPLIRNLLLQSGLFIRSGRGLPNAEWIIELINKGYEIWPEN